MLKSQGKTKKLPDMSRWTTQEIHEFWQTHSSADYWDQTMGVEVEVAKRRKRPVSVKLSEEDIAALQRIAAEKGMGYTTLLRVWIKEKLHEPQATR